MRTGFRNGIARTGAAALVGVALTMTPSAAQTPAPAFKAARTADGKPNLNGFWQAVNTANWDLEDHEPRVGSAELGVLGTMPPGLGVVVGGRIPYQPAAAATKQAHLQKRLTDDPEARCYLPGVPRATYLPYPFEIIQGPAKIVIVYGVGEATRTIHLDKVVPPPVDTWMGRSQGRFEGETLVVEVTGQNGMTWFDRSGNFASENLRVVERYTPLTPYHLQYEATLEDPTVFTRPWTISMPLYRRMEANPQILEFKCVEFSEALVWRDLLKK